jgi:hypothetical protein
MTKYKAQLVVIHSSVYQQVICHRSLYGIDSDEILFESYTQNYVDSH